MEVMETLRDRIKLIMAEHNMTQAAFADYIDVGRPNITHLMTGRDKSSQKIVSRILLAFPEINSRWLLNGEGDMYRKMPSKTQMEVDAALQHYENTHEMQTSLFGMEEALVSHQPSDTIVTSAQTPVSATVSASTSVSAPVPTPVQDQVSASDSASASLPTHAQNPTTDNMNTPISGNADTSMPETAVSTTPVLTSENPHPQQVKASTRVELPAQECDIPQPQGKRIRKIVFFYDDKTFEEYYPSVD